MSETSDFYQKHLDRVSRSFAFCIRQLNEPLKHWVGLSYLLCRAVDTIEDSVWPDTLPQMEAFSDFDRALRAPDAGPKFASWSGRLPDKTSTHERELVRESARLFTDLSQCPPQVREMIRDLVYCMSSGMQHFVARREHGQLRLKTLNEVNQYCFFVAGVVGELLAKLIGEVEPKFAITQPRLLNAYHFGLFLQKVNLLKDQVGDEREGRHLIPSRSVVEASAEENALGALAFLLDLPDSQREFRRFCAWSLFLGLQSMKVARDSQLAGRVLKVTRSEMEKTLSETELALSDNGKLSELFFALAHALGWNSGAAQSVSAQVVPIWLPMMYPGLLSESSLKSLGL